MRARQTDDCDDPTGGFGAVTPRLDRLDVLLGVVVAALVLGPILTPGPLLDLDLLVTPHMPIPNGIWGLGPALSQRVPLFVIFGLLSPIMGGPAAVKAFLLVGLTVGFVGASRAVASKTRRLGRLATAVLWTAGPFIVTRIAAGHIQFVWMIAWLPWLLPTLLAPSRRPARTFLALTAMAFGGPASGTIATSVVLVGLILEPRRRPTPVLGSIVIANLLWATPTAVLAWAGAEVAGADRFATDATGPEGWLGVLIGGGFWSPTRQIGAVGWGAAVAAVLLLMVAVFGRHAGRLRTRPLLVVGLLGLTATLASAAPGTRTLYAAVSRLSVAAPLRESQRFLLLWLAWLAPAVGVGAERLAEHVRRWAHGRRHADAFGELGRAVPLAIVLAFSVGGWWGAGDRVRPVDFPTGWEQAREFIRERPGTTVALPWNQYPPLDFLDGRHAFNPVPDFFGGDVVSSFDPLFDPDEPAQEQVDRRARVVDTALRSSQPLSGALDAIGARWAIVVRQPGSDAIEARLAAEPDAFEPAFVVDDATVWSVRSWTAPVRGPDGHPFELDRPLPPLIHTDAPPGSRLGVAGAPGWVQGWFRPVPVTESGLLEMPPGGSGPVWFWPALLLMMVDGGIFTACIVMVVRHRRRMKRGSEIARSLA